MPRGRCTRSPAAEDTSETARLVLTAHTGRMPRPWRCGPPERGGSCRTSRSRQDERRALIRTHQGCRSAASRSHDQLRRLLRFCHIDPRRPPQMAPTGAPPSARRGALRICTMLGARRRGRGHRSVDSLPRRELRVGRRAGGGHDQDVQLTEAFGQRCRTWLQDVSGLDLVDVPTTNGGSLTPSFTIDDRRLLDRLPAP